MAFMLYSIDEAIDHKYIVTSSLSGQAKSGTLIHIMDTWENSDGIAVNYRVTKTGQSFVAKFENIKQFCKWCKPDSFLTRHYESFSAKEISQYMKVKNRSVTSFCVPIIAVCFVVIWILALVVLHGAIGIVVGAVLSVVSVFAVFFIFRFTKEKVLERLYGKVNTGLSFK